MLIAGKNSALIDRTIAVSHEMVITGDSQERLVSLISLISLEICCNKAGLSPALIFLPTHLIKLKVPRQFEMPRNQ
jgi:hypothetical protein